MNNLNIIISAHNEAEYVKLSIQSIRMFSDIDMLSVILIDNNSSDNLQEWALEQTDITYIQNDGETMTYGSIINQVHEMLHLEGDLLLLEPHFLLTPSCLSHMLVTLHESSDIGAVGPLSNTLFHYQKCTDFSDYEAAVLGASQTHTPNSLRVMSLSFGAFLIKENTLKQLGNLDEVIRLPLYTMRDYCFRIIENNLELRVCKDAFLWDARNTSSPIYRNQQDEKYLEEKWGMHYFNSAGNPDLINAITHPSSASINILEIGCDCGATLLEIKNRFPNANVYGSELNEKAAHIASHFATTTVNNIENEDLPYDKNMFDYIIFGDVLEHLHNPQKTLEYCKELLNDTGCIIASIPNLMHISVINDLLKGNFTYTETGLLDKTHIHFFTYNEIQKMFSECGYHIVSSTNITLPITKQQHTLIEQLKNIYDTPKFMYETFQYVICAKKTK